MNASSDKQKSTGIRRAMLVLLCCGWLAAVAYGRYETTRTTDHRARVLGATPHVIMGSALAIAAIALSLSATGYGGLVAAVTFAAASSSLVAVEQLDILDALAAALAVIALAITMRTRRWWAGAAVVGLAAGVTPLCATAVIVTFAHARGLAQKAASLALTAAAAAGAVWLVRILFDRTFDGATAVWSDIALLGPQDVWRESARRLDLITPALIFALLAAADHLFARRDESPIDPKLRALTLWLLVNAIIAAVWPRMAVDHVLPLALPAFLMVPMGWSLLRCLPFDRKQWTLSLFSAICHVAPFALLYIPLKKAAGVLLVAAFPP